MPFETLLYEVRDHAALVTFNRPDKLNTWNNTEAAELSRALQDAQADDAVRAIVLTGAGRAFCAGADLERGADTFAGRDGDAGRSDRNVHPYEIDKRVAGFSNAADVLLSGRIFLLHSSVHPKHQRRRPSARRKPIPDLTVEKAR